MPVLKLKKDSKTGEPVKKTMSGNPEKMKEAGALVIHAFNNRDRDLDQK